MMLVIFNRSNNYGSFQYVEKFFSCQIMRILSGEHFSQNL